MNSPTERQKLHDGMPLASHACPRPFDTDFHGKPFEMHPLPVVLYSCRPQQIFQALTTYIRDLYAAEWLENTVQREGVQKWKRMRSTDSQDLGIEALMQDYAGCIDDIFFGGLLRGFYKIRFVYDPVALESRLGQCISHVQSDFQSYGHKYEIDIEILDRKHHDVLQKLDHSAQVKGYLETLIHEMVHAAFALFCCVGCQPCEDLGHKEVGHTGHGMLWQKLAISIENAFKESPVFIPNEKFNLNRSQSFLNEYLVSEFLQQNLSIRQLKKLKLNKEVTKRIRTNLQERDRGRDRGCKGCTAGHKKGKHAASQKRESQASS